MPLTLVQLAAETKNIFDRATQGMSEQEIEEFAWHLQTAMCSFPLEPYQRPEKPK